MITRKWIRRITWMFILLFAFHLQPSCKAASLLTSEATIMQQLRTSYQVSSTLWNSATDPCTWTGVTCVLNTTSQVYNVRNITLPYNGLRGRVQNVALSQLVQLDLHGNSLSGQLPNFSLFPKLQVLDLRSNQLTGLLPDFTGLPDLQVLNIGTNYLSGTIPNFRFIKKLQVLKASWNFLIGTLPNFKNITQLVKMQLNSNSFGGQIPDFNRLPALRSLELQNNKFTGTIPAFSNMPLLSYLDLTGNLFPTASPTAAPSVAKPTGQPSTQPSSQPTRQPFSKPSSQPSRQPTRQPTAQPSRQPSAQPTGQPILVPTGQPSRRPSGSPSVQPTVQPSSQPSGNPSSQPIVSPSSPPSKIPSSVPSAQPIAQPSGQPSSEPSSEPSFVPSTIPSSTPTTQPISQPSGNPTSEPSSVPSSQPSMIPSSVPSSHPISQPSGNPSSQPIGSPSSQPSTIPSSVPSAQPIAQPSGQPSSEPSSEPSSPPSIIPSSQPSRNSISLPTSQPTILPSARPSFLPTVQPTCLPSSRPSTAPSSTPRSPPTYLPSALPVAFPTTLPTHQPLPGPSSLPTSFPSSQSTLRPITRATYFPSLFPIIDGPSSVPSTNPVSSATGRPSNKATTQQPTNPFTRRSGVPTEHPSSQPSFLPTSYSVARYSLPPTLSYTMLPSESESPTSLPTVNPSTSVCLSAKPSFLPSELTPTRSPSATLSPSSLSTSLESSTEVPNLHPIFSPSQFPGSRSPSVVPSSENISSINSSFRSNLPSAFPSIAPTISLFPSLVSRSSIPTLTLTSTAPSASGSIKPTTNPSLLPTATPSISPTAQPTEAPVVKIFFPPLNQRGVLFLLGESFEVDSRNLSWESSFLGTSVLLFGSSGRMDSFQIDVQHRLPSYAILSSKNNAGVARSLQSKSWVTVGDMNNDTSDEVLVGDPIDFVCYIQSSSKVLSTIYYYDANNPSSHMTSLGWAVERVGDVNADGLNDILFSAPQANQVFLLFGSSSLPSSINLHSLSITQGIVIRGGAKDVNTGLSLAALGDFNRDGLPDFAITSVAAGNSSSVYIVLGNATWSNIEIDRLPAWSVITIRSPKNFFAGLTLAGLGDINGDGFADLAIGSVPYQGRYTVQRTYIVYGRSVKSQRSRRLVIDLNQFQEGIDGFVVAGAGFVVAGPGDVNGDGFADVMLTNYREWQWKNYGYVIVYPQNITSSPTTMPTYSPSLAPSSSSPTTSLPSSSPSSASDAPVVGIAPSRRPTIARTNKPSTPPTRSPSRAPSRIPTFRPFAPPTIILATLAPLAPTAEAQPPSISPFINRPSRRPSRRPSIAFPSSSPTSFPSLSLSHPYKEVIVNSTAHKYLAVGEKTRFLVVSAAAGVISIDGGDVPGGSNLYVIYPFTPSLRSGSKSAANQQMISIDHFHPSRDVIDLSLFRQFQKISDISYSTNPLILVLSDYQVILFPSISEMVLDASNFILSRPSKKESNSSLSVLDGTVYVALGIFLIMSLTAAFCGCVYAEKEKKEADSVLKRLSSSHDHPDKEDHHDDDGIHEDPNELYKERSSRDKNESAPVSESNYNRPDLPQSASRDLHVSPAALSSFSVGQHEFSSVRSRVASSPSSEGSEGFSSSNKSSDTSSTSSSFASSSSSVDYSQDDDDYSFASV